MLRAMRHVVRTVPPTRVTVSTRRDLLLEILALRHQLAVLARSNRRFRRSDRLLWLMLRRMWPRWIEALVLVQPATVDRWHRDWLGRRWWRRSRHPGRPRIDSQCRDPIGRLVEENRLWGAPRIHGELLYSCRGSRGRRPPAPAGVPARSWIPSSSRNGFRDFGQGNDEKAAIDMTSIAQYDAGKSQRVCMSCERDCQ